MKKGKWIFIVLLIALILIGVAIYFYSNNKNDESNYNAQRTSTNEENKNNNTEQENLSLIHIFPTLLEYMNIYTCSNFTFATTSNVSSNSSSVSPGNPTMMSVDKVKFGIFAFI